MEKNIYEIIAEAPLDKIAPKYIASYTHTGGENDIASSPFSDDDSKSHFRVNKHKNLWFDYAMNIGGNSINLLQQLYNLSYRQAAKKVVTDSPELFPGVDLKNFNFDSTRKDRINEADPKQNPVLTDLAFRCLMHIAYLTSADRRMLHNERHLSDAEIKKYGLFSMPACTTKMRKKLAEFVTSNGGDMKIFRYVPGFFEYKGQTYWNYGFAKGIAIPAKDIHNRIMGIQIRLENPISDTRYIWLSSANVKPVKKGNNYFLHGQSVAKDFKAEYGTGVGTPIATFDDGYTDQDLMITEGFFKGVQYHKLFHCKVAALPGVGSFKNLKEIFDYYDNVDNVLSYGKNQHHTLRAICIGYDADTVTTPQVFHSECRLYDYIRQYTDIPVNVITWNKKYGKGFDDLVFAHPTNYQQYLTVMPFTEFKAAHISLWKDFQMKQKAALKDRIAKEKSRA